MERVTTSIETLTVAASRIQAAEDHLRAIEMELDGVRTSVDARIRQEVKESQKDRSDIWREINKLRHEKAIEHRAIEARMSGIESTISTGKWAAGLVIAVFSFLATFLANIIIT